MSGYFGDLSPSQTETLEQFKTQIKDVARPEWDDYYYLRWLRARDFDLKKSELMLRNDVIWRKQINADKLLEEYKVPEVLLKYSPKGICGEDREGHPVMYYYFDLDLKGMVHSATRNDAIKSMAHELEKMYKAMESQSKKHDKKIEGIAVVFDLENLALKHVTYKPGIDMCLDLLRMMEDHYPETLYKLNVVNAPKIFPIAYAIVKPFLTQHTRNKIRIHSDNWQQLILDDIAMEEVPVFFGGQNRGPDGDPKCSHLICYGGEIPKSYYLQNSKEAIDKTKMDMAVVNKRANFYVEHHVGKAGSIIRWEFITDENDIGFGLYLKMDGTPIEKLKPSDLTNVRSLQRCNCHLVPETGSFIADVPGIYVTVFDNSYSWTKNKTLWYKVDVLSPDDRL